MISLAASRSFIAFRYSSVGFSFARTVSPNNNATDAIKIARLGLVMPKNIDSAGFTRLTLESLPIDLVLAHLVVEHPARRRQQTRSHRAVAFRALQRVLQNVLFERLRRLLE